MANRYLRALYRELYDRDFSYREFPQRLEMQKGIYLLQSLGVPVGDYKFSWYQHGPYSQKLQDDMYYEDHRVEERVCLTDEYARRLQALKQLVQSSEKGSYTVDKWVECIASLHYLQEFVLPFGSNDDVIVKALEEKKPHLNEHAVNVRAIGLISHLFSQQYE